MRAALMLRTTLLALLLGVTAARASAPAAAAPSPPIDPVFDCYRLNYAWGFALAGSVVDRNGTIYRYRSRDRDRSPAAQRDGAQVYYAAADLRAKFAEREPAGSVAASVLGDKIALVDAAAGGAVTRSDTGVRDAGSSTCHAYLAEADGGRYRDVELGSDGGVADTLTRNDADEARALIDWLRTLGVAQ